jgi:hypothetical protein
VQQQLCDSLVRTNQFLIQQPQSVVPVSLVSRTSELQHEQMVQHSKRSGGLIFLKCWSERLTLQARDWVDA